MLSNTKNNDLPIEQLLTFDALSQLEIEQNEIDLENPPKIPSITELYIDNDDLMNTKIQFSYIREEFNLEKGFVLLCCVDFFFLACYYFSYVIIFCISLFLIIFS